MLAVYFGVLIALSYVASRRVSNLKDYFAGDKNLGFWVAAFSTQATGESAWLLLGLTGMGAMIGVTAYWVVVGEVIGVAIAWFVMAKRFKGLTDQYDSLTVTDYLESRFRAKSHLLRLVASISLTIFVLVYISAQVDATGSAFERFLGWDYHIGAIVGFVSIPVWKFVMQNIDGLGAYFSALDTLPPAFLMSMLAGYLVSKLLPDARLAEIYTDDVNSIKSL